MVSVLFFAVLIVAPVVNPYYRRPTYKQYDETL